jgi:hypothetical protein
MKQPLKFRVWEPQNESYQIVTLEELLTLESAPSHDQVDQFTGLQDKFNQEIYNGDILLCRDDEGDYSHQPVEFFIRTSFDGEEADYAGYLQIPHNREVVGNIRETPELRQEGRHSL